MHQILLNGTSQTLEHVPAGYVSAATFVLEDLAYSIGDASRMLASGSCTAASWSLTTSASAGPTASNGRRLSTAATTGATVGAPAVVTAADGSREVIEIAAVSSASYVEASATLAATYASGSTVKGILLTAAVPDLVAANEDLLEQQHPIRIVWSYTLDGVKHRVQHAVEFTRHTGADVDVGSTLISLSVLYPDIATRLPDGARWNALVTELTRSIRVDLRARNVDPERLMLGDAGVELLMLRAVEHAAYLGWAPGSQDPVEFYRLAHARYRERFEALTTGVAGRGVIESRIATDTSPANPDATHRGPFLPS
jgi:hypothetical protein